MIRILLALVAVAFFSLAAAQQVVLQDPASIPLVPAACNSDSSEWVCLVYIAQRLLSLDQESNQPPDALRVLVYALPLFAFFAGVSGGAAVAGGGER